MENYLRQEIKDQICKKIYQEMSEILQDYDISPDKIQIIIAGVISHSFLILDKELYD